ncbi:MAG TPA: DUF2179 domain-containing protein [Thermoanaerobaculia bacterium]|nr:DUF2179 domain-containing protein [Thermoanaerobaculia bacterium]
MESLADVSSQINVWLLTPLLIFLARVCDVTIGTIRIISLSRGRRVFAPILGFFEILIWLFAIRQIFAHVDQIPAFVAYAAGFAAGNFVGILIEDKIALGHLAIRAITADDASDLIRALRAANYGVTTVAAEGQSGKVQLIFMVILRKEYERVMEMIARTHPKAFVSVSDVRAASEGVFPRREYSTALRFPRRKGK